jgi:hypothetical protein
MHTYSVSAMRMPGHSLWDAVQHGVSAAAACCTYALVGSWTRACGSKQWHTGGSWAEMGTAAELVPPITGLALVTAAGAAGVRLADSAAEPAPACM